MKSMKNTHERTHMGIFNYACAYCPKQFTENRSKIHHERFGSLNHHNHHSQHDLKNFSAEKFYNEAAAARSFLNAATSFSDQYNAAQRANYFNVSSAAAAGFFGNLQSQTAAAAAANAAAAASFPASMSPNSNMSHLLQVESSLRNDHPMHGRILNIK